MPPSDDEKKFLALCKSEWVVGMGKVFTQLFQWQGGEAEEGQPPALYESTLWSMLIAAGAEDVTLTAWTAFFDEDMSGGTISVRNPWQGHSVC